TAALTIMSIMLVAPIGTGASISDFNYTGNPIVVPLGALGNTVLPNGLSLCKSAALGSIVCYSPRFIKKAYGFPSTSTLDGSGQTIVIVDAFGSPTIASDLALFDARFGIPAPPSFTIFCGNSATPLDTTTCPNDNIFANAFNGSFAGIKTPSIHMENDHALEPATIQ